MIEDNSGNRGETEGLLKMDLNAKGIHSTEVIDWMIYLYSERCKCQRIVIIADIEAKWLRN